MKHKILSILLSVVIIFSFSSNVLAASNEPDIVGTSAVSIDAKTGEVIYSKNPDLKIFPASTTKLLTAILLNEYKKPSDYMYYSASAKEQPESSFDKNIHTLNVGERLSADDVLKSLLMYSANDMAYVIASNIINKNNAPAADVRNNFSVIMNNEVKKLGLKNTHFITPNGLHDPNHYSTAYDMSRIAKAAFSIKWIQKTISTQEATITLDNGTKCEIKNTNKIIDPKEPVYDKTCMGGKTGFTNEAGRCLITIFNRNGEKIIGVVMKSVYDKDDVQVFKDMDNLMNYSYSIKPTTLYTKNQVYSYETVNYKLFKYFGPEKAIKIPLILKDNVDYYKNSFNDSEKKLIKKVSLNAWNLKENAPVGTLTLKERDTVKNYNLYTSISSNDILSDNKFVYIGTFVCIILVIGLAVFGCIKFFRRK